MGDRDLGIVRRSTSDVKLPIHERTFEYALRAIRLFRYLQKTRDGAAVIMGRQFLRAATSVGANVEEAQAAESRPDFVHKMSISQKEARESLYWLRLLHASESVPGVLLVPIIDEAKVILAIISKILVSSRKRK
jgi:four helix bundle protein